jgi:hypothetical protein
MEQAHARLTQCALPGLQCSPEGVFLHQRSADVPLDRSFGPPDPNVLISSVWVDLSTRPWRLAIPASGSRYLAIDVLDMNASHVTVPPGDAAGGAATVLMRDGRDSAAAAGATHVIVGTDRVWVVVRVAFDGETDGPAVNAFQNDLRIEPMR